MIGNTSEATGRPEISAQTRGPHERQPIEPRSVRRVISIEPRRGWRLINIGELWRSRELLFFLAMRDIKVRYKQTLLGAAWAILQPFLMMLVFTVFLGRMAHVPCGDLPYPIFVYAGVLPWSFFATAVASAGNSVVGSERLITKIYFPRLVIPLAAVGAAVIDFCIAFPVLLVMMVWYGIRPGPEMALVPIVLALLALSAVGVGTLLAALNVAYRDFRYVIPFLLQLWLFATPSVYMSASASEAAVHDLLELNPLTGLIGVFRSAVLPGSIAYQDLAFSALGTLAFFVMGCLYFRRVEDSFADVI
jgi:lipopolysaccharide transport system permease protein